MTGIAAQQVMCGSVHYCAAETTALPLVAPLPPNFIVQPLQNLHIEMTSNTLSGVLNSLCTNLSLSKNSGNSL
jgi:hypothetical protein